MIYYVEDDVNIRDLAIYALKQAGFEAQGFPEADEFFAACKTRVPDLVLLDIMLPGTDGLEILRMRVLCGVQDARSRLGSARHHAARHRRA